MTEETVAPDVHNKAEYKFQISNKVGDLIYLVRGDDLQLTIDDCLVMADIIKAAIPEQPSASQVRAAQAVRGGASIVSDAESCQHGERVYKSGNKKSGNGTWAAWDCPRNICDRKWA